MSRFGTALKQMVFILGLFCLALPLQAQAQSWEERQRIYNEQSNLRQELFLQQQEMEQMQRQQREQARELERERERLEYQMRKVRQEEELENRYKTDSYFD